LDKLKYAFKSIHPPSNKLTATKKIEKSKIPEVAIIPLKQHIGSPSVPVVSKKDTVSCGQLIGKIDGFISANTHSSISGVVKNIQYELLPTGDKALAVTIESDGSEAEPFYQIRDEDISELSKDDIIKAITEAGIVGLGGAGFPTHVKLTPPVDKPIDTLIINAAECEPYLTSDYRIMLEKTDEVIKGAQLLKKALEADNCFIAIEDNKPDAIKLFRERLKNSPIIKVAKLETKYPYGAEKILIKMLTGREVPVGGLPMDVGLVVQNVSAAYSAYEAVMFKKPLYERVITVTGEVNEPKNLLVRIGTPVSQIIEECGGYTSKARRIINGGPMMGISLLTDEVPVIKNTTGILILPEPSSEKKYPCINCNRCTDVCTMGLIPRMFDILRGLNRFEEARDYDVINCMECGCCEYVCPSRVPIVESVKQIKGRLKRENMPVDYSVDKNSKGKTK